MTRNIIPNCVELIALALVFGVVLAASSWTGDADSKKVAAISTCILIGLIFFLGVISADMAWVIAVCHAQYKTSLFFALALILADANSQDVRRFSFERQSNNCILGVILLLVIATGSTFYAITKSNCKLVRVADDYVPLLHYLISALNWSTLLIAWCIWICDAPLATIQRINFVASPYFVIVGIVAGLSSVFWVWINLGNFSGASHDGVNYFCALWIVAGHRLRRYSGSTTIRAVPFNFAGSRSAGFAATSGIVVAVRVIGRHLGSTAAIFVAVLAAT